MELPELPMELSWVTVVAGLALFTLIPGSFNRYSGLILAWPAMVFFYVTVFCELVAYIAVRLTVFAFETVFAHPAHRRLRRLRGEAANYAEWYKLSAELDQDQKHRRDWAADLTDWTAKLFSWIFVTNLRDDMKLAREEGDVMMALAVLQQVLRKNVGGIFSRDLYSHLHTGEPKDIVTGFVDEIVTTLDWAVEKAACPHCGGKNKEAVRHLVEGATATYGRTALCLSGGGMIGCYHLGIVKALLSEKVLPEIISGASSGSLIAALVCTRTDEELERDINPEVLEPRFTPCARSWPDRIRSLLKNGCMFDNEEWYQLLIEFITCGTMTFEEAYEKTGRTLCITLSTTSKMAPPVLLNHLSAPDVVIASAVVASASAPGLLKPTYLRSKDANGKIVQLKEEYWDGSIEQDLPLAALSEQLNCQYFIVAQINPHLNPFYFYCDGSPGHPNRWTPSRRGGHLLSGLEMYLKMDMQNKVDFLSNVGAVQGVTSNLLTQVYEGTTTIVPELSIVDYFKIVEDPDLDDMKRYFQGGSVATYGNMAMIKLHFRIARAIEAAREALTKESKTIDDELEELMTFPTQRTRLSIEPSLVPPSPTPPKDLPKGASVRTLEYHDDSVWEPIKYKGRGTIFQGAVQGGRGKRGTIFNGGIGRSV